MVAAARQNATDDRVYLYHPETLDMGEILRGSKVANRVDEGLYITHAISARSIAGHANDDHYVPLHARYIDKMVGERVRKTLTDTLEERGVIERERDGHYIPGVKSIGYRWHSRFMGGRATRTEATSPRFRRAWKRNRERLAAEERPLTEVQRLLKEQQYRLSIDIEQAEGIIAGLPAKSDPYGLQYIIARNIHERRFHFSSGNYGRVTNSISSMSREVRPSLRVGTQKLASVDLSNSQPAIPGQTAREQAAKATGNVCIYDLRFGPDLDRYCHLTETGTWYESLGEMLDAAGVRYAADPERNRKAIKKRFLVDVLAKAKAGAVKRKGKPKSKRPPSDAEYPSEMEDVFRAEFPSVYRFIRLVNRDGHEHCNLIRLLQTWEAGLVLDRVAAGLMARYPWLFVLTLHDSIFTTADHIDLVEREFRAAFAERGISMALKTE